MTVPRRRLPWCGLAGLVVFAGAAGGQEVRTGLEIGGVPAINYDADEGFGYGAIAELYQYGVAGLRPYEWTLQPTVFLTTGGRRDFTVFFDAPHVLPGGWRVDVYAGSEKQIATPYYGLGNGTAFDEAADDGANPYYYRYGRTRRSVATNVQHSLGGTPLRALFGVGAAHVSVDAVPEDEGTTLLAEELAAAGLEPPSGWSNHIRAGLIWDTRDRETGPRRGTWTELLVQRVSGALGSDRRYTRWTFTDRRYFSLRRRLVFAHRVLVQGVSEGAPLHDLSVVQTSFKQQEGLGGAKTVRGMLKNRYVGRGLLVWNAELRWRAAEFRMLGRSFHTVLSVFVDAGRVWHGDVDPGELFSGLHHGAGGGARLGMGENFVVAVDAGTSAETTAQLYIGLGYLY